MGSIGAGGLTPPKTQRAVIIEARDHVGIRADTPFPTLQNNQFLIRTDAISINPSDTKMRGDFVTPGGVLGTDYAGTVVARGPEATDVEVGDRVCGA